MRVLPCGEAAVLLDCEDAEEARRWHAALREHAPALGARTVLLRGRPDELRALVASTEVSDLEVVRGREMEVEVVYDGPDLADVGRHCGLAVDEVVRRHTGSPWTVGFAGFAPGFAYLTGGDPRLEVPRLDQPRPRVDAGSVALAGPFSGIYPRSSPGGWQLIGRTDAPLWDLGREDPALLRPGDVVRFVAVDR
ncbi:allophanate hydrolase subunit 1 [Aeromicrobium senzhongii]|uniref:Allophanate hydrolase subunit 1 n=1 Tax=Aeromicrobium senzhongii TaxID=2663859 RepID=A0ABX6SUJ9_9ACTN|nr:allophanate hydrolase subunit 1 [Aeromicrobium senzhongii]MTB88057.1 carboxyltransferase domain-containing protein [Aeromicrobium senzhongii]QNL94942.1 allophanate hydrolase subunit 1 [Aeromicrobium senzhongii]